MKLKLTLRICFSTVCLFILFLLKKFFFSVCLFIILILLPTQVLCWGDSFRAPLVLWVLFPWALAKLLQVTAWLLGCQCLSQVLFWRWQRVKYGRKNAQGLRLITFSTIPCSVCVIQMSSLSKRLFSTAVAFPVSDSGEQLFRQKLFTGEVETGSFFISWNKGTTSFGFLGSVS